MHKPQLINPKQKQKRIIHEYNKLCVLQTGRKITRSVKKIKAILLKINNFITSEAFQLHKLSSVT